MKRSIPILLYHHVAPGRQITPEAFEAQLRRLKDEGYAGLSMDDLVRSVRGEKAPPPRSYAVSFDDGYQDNQTHAFPVLQRLSIPAIIYLVTERVGTEGFLSWEGIRAMSGSDLITFGSHTQTHRHFVRREPYADVNDELQKSKDIIDDRVGKPCRHLAWPWGDYEDDWLPLVKSAGYRSAATTLSGANTSGKDPYALKRINVRRADIDWFLSRLRRNRWALQADLLGPLNAMDRRLKVWWNNESPYSHG